MYYAFGHCDEACIANTQSDTQFVPFSKSNDTDVLIQFKLVQVATLCCFDKEDSGVQHEV